MSWKQTTQNSFADSLVVEHKSLSELDDVHNIINKGGIFTIISIYAKVRFNYKK
jgi:IS5 family transposase